MTKIKRRKKTSAKKPQLTAAKSRYRFKEGFSEKVKTRARKAYRQAKGSDFELQGSVVLRALEFIDVEAKTLPVTNHLTSKSESLPVLRLNHAAKLLSVSYQTLWRWTSETQQVPMPVLTDQTSGREYPVYHVEEVRVMVRIIGEHLRSFKYYRKDHEATKTALFTEIEALRALNFKTQTEKGSNHHGTSQKRPRTRRKSISRK